MESNYGRPCSKCDYFNRDTCDSCLHCNASAFAGPIGDTRPLCENLRTSSADTACGAEGRWFESHGHVRYLFNKIDSLERELHVLQLNRKGSK